MIKERGQVIACINMLGLNNELFRSHVDLKRRLVEMCVQAVLSDYVSDKSQAAASPDSAAIAEHVMQWAYDLIVLDPYGNFGKKVNEPLLGKSYIRACALCIPDRSSCLQTVFLRWLRP